MRSDQLSFNPKSNGRSSSDGTTSGRPIPEPPIPDRRAADLPAASRRHHEAPSGPPLAPQPRLRGRRPWRTLSHRDGLALGSLFAAALIVRLLAWSWLQPAHPIADMRGYLRQAVALVAGDGGDGALLPPAYPALLSLVIDPRAPARLDHFGLLQALTGSLAVAGTYFAARSLLGRRTARIGAGALALYPPHIVYCTLLLSEVLAVTLVAWALAGVAQPRDARAAAAGGLALGLAALTRVSAVALVPLLALVVWRRAGQRQATAQQTRPRCSIGRLIEPRQPAARQVIAFLVAALLPVLVWSARASRLDGRPVLICGSGGYNLLLGNNPFADGTQRGGTRYFAREDPVARRTPDAGAPARHGTRLALHWIVTHPRRFVRKGLTGALRMFGLERQLLYSMDAGYYARPPGRAGRLLLCVLTMAPWLLLCPLAILGSVARSSPAHAPGRAALAWICLIGFAVFGEWRFRMTALPLLLLAALGGGHALRARSVRRRECAVTLLCLLPIVTLWCAEVIERARDVLG